MIETPADILSHYADREAVDSFIAYRRRHKRAALSERGAVMIAKSLRQINAEGGDATEALDMAQEMGWQTVRPEWYWRVRNGNGNCSPGHSRANTGIDQIAFAAAASRAPSEDSF